MAYGKFKMGKSKPMPIGLDDLRNRSKKPPKPGKRPEPLTPRGPRNPVPVNVLRMGYGPGEKPSPRNSGGLPGNDRKTIMPVKPKKRGL